MKEWDIGGWVGSASMPACYVSSLGSNPDISKNYKMGDKSKGVANTHKPAKKIHNNKNSHERILRQNKVCEARSSSKYQLAALAFIV
jgi:hypothetical protein